MNAEEAQTSVLDASSERPIDASRDAGPRTIDGHVVRIAGKMPRIARVRDEPFQCVEAPDRFIERLRRESVGADLFTFTQELADRTPNYAYHLEWDSHAVAPITSYDQWWKQQIDGKSRNMVRKAEKGGVVLRAVAFDDALVRGIQQIYDETPVRQGKRFVHCGKDFETLKRDHATFLSRSAFIGAYYQDELIGFAKLVRGKNVASLMQILSMIKHRDKAPTNALVAEAVAWCAREGVPYLHYGVWSTGGLGMFKTSLGFVRHDVPRYFVPLNPWGRLLLKANLHHKWSDLVPPAWQKRLAPVRARWNTLRYGA